MAKVIFDHTKKDVFDATGLTKIKVENRDMKIIEIMSDKNTCTSEKIELLLKLCKQDEEMLVYLIIHLLT